MINVTLICVGTLKERFLRDAVAEYQKRLTTLCKFNICEISEEKTPENASQNVINTALDKEADKIISKIPKGSIIIPLVIEGKQSSSVKFAKLIEKFSVEGKSNLTFVIGSSFGLSEKIKKTASFKMSMSEMTFPHQLARVMLCEQIYRAFQILNNTKYNK